MSFAVGETVGDYQILSVLGQGGMGAVYRVRNILSQREEAMKVVRQDFEVDPQSTERFLREIRVQASLRHPNIAELRTAVRVADRILMIMELVDGWSVGAKIKDGPMRFDVAFRVIDDILSALAYAHKQGVVHRDIKPANIMVSAQGQTKLTDFGIARAAGESRLTQTAATIGSLHYMAPEQIQSNQLDERSDLYSLGVTFYEMLTARLPVQGETPYAVMHAHMTAAPVPPIAFLPDLPVEVSEVVMRSLAKSPYERFASAQVFQSALREALFGGRPPAAPTGNLAPTASVPLRAGTAAETRVSPAIDPQELQRVEARLMASIGPIAKSLVKNAARRHTSLPALCNELGAQISDAKDREAFLGAFGAAPAARPAAERAGSGGPGPSWPRPISEEALQAARKALAEYVGPMAKMIVERAAKRVHSLDELREALAAEIPDERDKRAFRERFRA